MTTTLLWHGAPHTVTGRWDNNEFLIAPASLQAVLGWQLKEVGLCRGDACLPLALRPGLVRDGLVDLGIFADMQRQPLIADASAQVIALGKPVANATVSLQAPDFTLPDLAGKLHSLSGHRGKKVLLVVWASWCGCRDDLPEWNALYEQFRDQGFVVITVAQDANVEDARPFIERAKPSHPALVDTRHELSHLYGFINVPSIVWIDENGMIVRPPRVEHATNRYQFAHGLDCEPHLQALKHWIATGETDISDVASEMVLPTFVEELARAEFALGFHLYSQGQQEKALPYFEAAIQHSPDDWTIRRGTMWLRGLDPFGQDFFDVWSEWEQRGKPDYQSLAAARRDKGDMT